MGIGAPPPWVDGTEEDDWEDWYDPRNPWTPLPGVRTGAELTRGEKAADAMRNKMGSWAFVGWFVVFMVSWAVLNSFALNNNGFDPYPYILLNLFLSMLAGLQGAILLIAAKRADAIAAEQALSHLTISKVSSEIIAAVKKDLASNTHLTHEIHAALKDIQHYIAERENND